MPAPPAVRQHGAILTRENPRRVYRRTTRGTRGALPGAMLIEESVSRLPGPPAGAPPSCTLGLDIARRLHDTVGQALVTLVFALEDLGGRVGPAQSPVVAALHGQARLALDDLRNAMTALIGRPPPEEGVARAHETLRERLLAVVAAG